MKKSTMVWVWISVVMLIVGAVLFIGGAVSVGFDFDGLNVNGNVTEHTYSVDEDFEHILFSSDISDLRVLPSGDESCRVVIKEIEKLEYSVNVENGTLTVREKDDRKWYERIGISWGDSAAVIYLPAGEYVDLTAESGVGDITVDSGFSFGAVKLKSDTGKVTLKGAALRWLEADTATGNVKVENITVTESVAFDTATGKISAASVKCGYFSAESETGDIVLSSVIVTGNITIENDTGDVHFDACDAASVKIETDTGDVKGTFLTDKIFSARSDTGRVKVPKSTSGGLCEIETDTGDIKIEIVK